MAINQQPLSRSITLPTTNVSTGSGLTQLANATSALGQVLSERINAVAIEQSALQGEQDVANERQPEKLALPFTKATKAYNDAVARTEANRMINSAEQLINESLANNKNPATFTRETPAKFKAELDGIKSGILQNTRDENREHVRQALDRMTTHASLNMLQHSIQYDNQRMKFDMQHDISGLLEARRNAAIAGDEARIAGIDAALDQSISDYAMMNQEINQIAPYLKEDIAKHRAIDSVLTGYTQALSTGNTARYLADLAENKQKLPFNVWQDAVKGVVALDQTQKRLTNDINAEQWAQVQFGINNGSIQDAADILNYNELTVPQQLTAMKQLDTIQAKQLKQGSELIAAQQNILSGRPEFNSASTRDKMFQASIQAMEKETGQVATLQDMENSVLGLNQYPASGMPQTPMGTNVPAFDSVLQGKLTSGDVMATAQAAMVYNDMVNVKEMPNSVNLTGEALSVATLFNTLNKGGTTPEEAAALAINTVLNAKEPEIAQRIDRFHKTIEKTNPQTGQQDVMRSKFKEAFGLAPQDFGSDEAFRVFKDTYRAHYLLSNSEQAAFDATKQAMRAWGTSKYFDKGYVGQPVPEKEIPITKVAYAFDNQIVANLQGFINRNKAARDANPDLNIPVIEWANPKQTITGNESEQDKVFKNLTVGKRPRIKINGHETDVVLMPSATSRLDNRVNYLLGVYDQFNNLTPLKDITNPVDQVARFAPQELSIWAPSVATEQTDKDLRSVALKIQKKEMQQDTKELKALQDKTPAWQVIFGLSSGKEYLDYIEKRRAESNEGRLETIIESLKGRTAPEVRDETTEAENIGISPNLEPPR
ncbi:TPA: hypothetical protein ACG3NN_002857 [Legionella pneumophila]